eukprot:TRINITY_DN14088_c0_g1_i1.p1 TRINITY_DN14088_c0_g1~~TRINITY_DN14088_c0_g1_i1.p1  ORF type:complete len:1071 (+),score=285.92 TRINITY_DN14088_c0_g1_i1:327-3215(+)
MSRMESQASIEVTRTRCLVNMRASLNMVANSKEITQFQVEQLFNQQEFCLNLFSLFDQAGQGFLVQEDWIAHLRNCCTGTGDSESMTIRDDQKTDLVEMLESVTYLICQDDPVQPPQFCKIWSSRGVAPKLLKCIDKDMDAVYTVEEFMAFIVAMTSKIQDGSLTKENIAWLEKVFRDNVGEGQEEFTLQEFKKIVPSKNKFFVEGAFRIFDKDGSGTVSLEEFLETMHQFANQGEEEKLAFLFRVYDPNGDGQIDQTELREIIKSCVAENGMEFDEDQVNDLAQALFVDAVKPGKDGITVDDLSDQFKKHKGLLENLTLSIGKWLVPPKPVPEKPWQQKLREKLPQNMNMKYFRNNQAFIFFLCFIILANMILFIQRVVYFRNFTMLSGYTPNPFYLLSRACGRTLLFNSVLILCLVLRYTITLLRNMGLASILPLDNNIYFHKLTGRLIFVQAWIHALMHFINFGVNIQPDPVKFVQLTAPYWGNWTTLGYQPPPGCEVVPNGSNLTQFCSPDAFLVPDGLTLDVNITHCEACLDTVAGARWAYSDWIFTSQPGVFGLVGGYANPTGVALIIILTVMVICSMSFVRRSGYFLVFYFSHLNYVFFWGILLVHAPEFWKWFFVFGCIWFVELTYRLVSAFLGHGKSVVDEGISLPSRVTYLKIKKPPKFNYSPGDWCFIKIPKIATFEWHPFTISSAPEDLNHFSVHVRGVGQWTNKLYEHFKHKNEMKTKMIGGGQKFGQNKDLELNPMNFSIERPLEVFVDGPFGSPSSNIFRAEHAILVGTGVGVTPFASILQSIVHRYRQVKKECPSCEHKWSDDVSTVMNNLKKVDFFWINRDQKSFEWFVSLLTQLEMEQAETGGALGRFLEMHMYVTSALQKTDMKSVFLQLAMDLNFKKEQRDLVTGLKSRTNAGRPNWNKIFAKVKEQRKGKVTVFFCGNPTLGRVLKQKCNDFGFTFRKEVF